MNISDTFEADILVAADFAKAQGFTQTYLALLEVLRQHREAIRTENHSPVRLH